MAFVKVIKNRSYFIRYQVKYRRRREGKTDYQARRSMITQDKNKYNTPKYRLVVRFTNRDIVAQVVRSKIEGDYVVAAAYGHELAKFGIPVGHTNYAAAYAVGLLVARRVLTKFGLADKYQGKAEVNGEDFNVTPIADGPRPVRVLLDTGLKRTSTGSRVFATLKGASDGGLDIPHSVNRFVGYDSVKKALNGDVLRNHLFGAHVAAHMRDLKEEDNETYQRKFSTYIKNKVEADAIEDLYKKAHKAIRANPVSEKKPEKKVVHKRFHKVKLTYEERKAAVKVKLAARDAAKSKDAGDEEEEEEEENDEADE